MLNVTLPRQLQKSFKLRACRAFPREFIAFLAGKRVDGGIEIGGLWYPPDYEQRLYCDEGTVEIPSRWWTEAAEFSAEQKMITIGTVHTHTYRLNEYGSMYVEPVLSSGDIAAFHTGELIAGVANVYEYAANRKRCSDISFFTPSIPVSLDVV